MAHVAAVHAAKKKKARRKKDLDARRREKLKDEQKIIDEWFVAFDTNQSGDLCNDQLKALLQKMDPEHEPTEESIQFLMGQYAGCGKNNKTGIEKESLVSVFRTYRSYCKEKERIDSIFEKYDTNKSLALERDQLMTMMREIAKDSGIEVEDGDVDYVLENCDKSSTGSILRGEALPAVATWRDLILEKQNKKSSTCVMM